MINKVILDICDHPPTMTYTNTAYPLSILCRDNNYDGWFYSNYANITSIKDPGNINRLTFISGDAFGGVEPLVYKKELLEDGKDVFYQLYSLLSDGWHVFTFLDFDILDLTPRTVHNILLYGIDNDHRVIYTLCYLNGKFTTNTIDFEAFLDAYNSYNNTRKSSTRCMKPRDKKYEFSDEIFEAQLLDYFHSEFPLNKLDRYYRNVDKIRTDENELMEEFVANSRKDGGYYYGFDCYESLKQYLTLDGVPEHIDIRPYRLIWEHKNIMKDRFVFFQREKTYPFDMSYYIEQMGRIEGSTRILFNLILKAKIKKTFSIGHITDLIDKIKCEEYLLLEKMISEIRADR